MNTDKLNEKPKGAQGDTTALPLPHQRNVPNETRGTGHSSPPPAATPHLKRPALTLYPSALPGNTYPSPDGMANQAKALLRTVRRLRPKRKRGRPRTEQIDKAVALYLAGARSTQLYNAVIPNFAAMNYYRRKHEKRRLDDDIRKRLKRVGIPPKTNPPQ